MMYWAKAAQVLDKMMSTTITAPSTSNVTDAPFKKLDTKQKGYIDAADLKAAAGDDSVAESKSAEVFKQLDSDGNGKVTKSELSAAVEKVGSQLDAQMDQSRVQNATGGAKAGERAGGHGGGGGAPPAKSGSGSDTETATKYVAAADTNGDGTVSADEEAAYKKLLASAETKSQAQVQEYKNISGDSSAGNSGSVDVSA
jgi:hypothetical protein